MLARIWQYLAPPVFEGDEEKTGSAGILYALLVITLVGAVVFPVSLWIIGDPMESPVDVIVVVLIVATVLMLILLRQGYVRQVGTALSLILWAVFTIPIFTFGGIHDSALTGYFVAVIMAGIVAGWRTLLLVSLLSILSIGLAYLGENTGLLDAVVPIPSMPDDLVLVVMMLVVSALLLRYAVQRMSAAYERARDNALALESSNIELQESQDRMAAQSRELERRTRYLEATSSIARDTASVLDLQTLLTEVVGSISQQLGFYHTGVFMIESDSEWAVLQAASSQGGQQMLARGHRLALGTGIVGHAAATGEPRLALDVGEDAVYFDNPDLPETRSEVALPLQARGDLIGVLDVQSRDPGAFSDQDVHALQTLADQVAVAINNALLFGQVQESLEVERRAYGELSQEAWRALLHQQSDLRLVRDERGIAPASETWRPEAQSALRTGKARLGGDGARNLVVPIQVRGQVIGTLDGQKPEEAGEWTPQQIQMMETLSEQLGDALEDARLYQDARRRAIQEQLIGDISSQMRQSLDTDSILRTAVREMHKVLGLAEAEVRLGIKPSPQGESGGADGGNGQSASTPEAEG